MFEFIYILFCCHILGIPLGIPNTLDYFFSFFEAPNNFFLGEGKQTYPISYLFFLVGHLGHRGQILKFQKLICCFLWPTSIGPSGPQGPIAVISKAYIGSNSLRIWAIDINHDTLCKAWSLGHSAERERSSSIIEAQG